MRMFKVTACVPSQTRIRTQRELQNTYFTKLVSYDNWFSEQQRNQKMGGKIVQENDSWIIPMQTNDISPSNN